MTSEATFTVETPVGHWRTGVPIAANEQRHAYSTGSRRGSLFLTTQLGISPGYRKGEILYILSGPNIRQDGTEGAYTLSRRIERGEVEENYPDALELAKTMLADGMKRIFAHAQSACEEIIPVIARPAIEQQLREDAASFQQETAALDTDGFTRRTLDALGISESD